MVFLNSSSEVLYVLQSEARRSTPLLLLLTARSFDGINNDPQLSSLLKYLIVTVKSKCVCVHIPGPQEKHQEPYNQNQGRRGNKDITEARRVVNVEIPKTSRNMNN